MTLRLTTANVSKVLFDVVLKRVYVHQPSTASELVDVDDKLFYRMLYITIMSYITFFLADATAQHIVLESVHAIAFYQTNLDIYNFLIRTLFKDVLVTDAFYI